MKEVQRVAQKVLALGMDILLFTWQIVRRVILPTLNRKGNVLSSLLTFFVGLLERIVTFERSILQRPVLFTHKYVKQGLIVGIGFLFLLSSFEWTIAPGDGVRLNGSAEVVACARLGTSFQKGRARMSNCSPGLPLGAWAAAWSYHPSRIMAGPNVIDSRWLRFLVFRI